MPRTKPLTLLSVVATLLGLLIQHGLGQASTPPVVPARHQVKVWHDTDGLPQNSVFAVARTPAGYMWMGTAEGLVRFDGVRFTVFDTGNTPALGNSHVTSLLVDYAGTLWIGTAGGGLVRYRDEVFTNYSTRDGLSEDYITCLCEDQDGSLWVGTFTRGLNRWKNGRGSRAAPELADTDVSALAMGMAGDVWIGTSHGVFRLRENGAVVCPPPEGTTDGDIRSLCCDRAGRLWAGTSLGLQRLEGDRLVAVNLPANGRSEPVRAIHEARDGTVWVGRGREVLRRGSDGRFVPCETQGELPKNSVLTLREDPEGNVWVGTDSGGLIRLRHGPFGAYSTRDGLSGNFVRAVFQDTNGMVWTGTDGGLDRWQDGRFVPATRADRSLTTAITQDREGTLWVNTTDENRRVCRLEGGELVPLTTAKLPAVRTLLADRTGDLWLGTNQGLLRYSPSGTLRPWPEGTAAAFAYIVNLFEDRSGAVWIGTVGGGVSRYRDGRFTTWTTTDGLSSNHVLSFYEDGAGALWIGTHGGGLNRFKDGKFTAVTTRDGLYDDLAFSIHEDAFGNFWMSGNKGVYRAKRQELDDFADGRVRRVSSYAYGVADGMLSRECNGGSPTGWKARDSTLWFATIEGVATVDPARRNLEPSRLAIEAISVDHAPCPMGAIVRLEPGQADLEIQYTGLAWTRPEQIRFRYRLAGLDQGWTDAGTRRTAYFSHLPPGDYAFQVRADNGDGVWSEAAASLPILVLPPFWRTRGFLALAAGATATLVGGGFRWRGRQMRRRYAQQQEFSRRLIAAHETERRRIAAELHDGLGQTLAMIKNSAVFGTRNARDLAAARAQMDQITQQSTQAIGEVREIAYNLRPYLLDRLGLTKALRSMLNKVADASTVTLDVDLDPLDGFFGPEAEMSIYRIVQESINNVLKHADATAAVVRIQAEETAVQITVQDDGRGFDPARQDERRGFGLLGIAERVRLLNGIYAVRSQVGEGTTLSVCLPHLKPIHPET